jgi:hypothetical protein
MQNSAQIISALVTVTALGLLAGGCGDIDGQYQDADATADVTAAQYLESGPVPPYMTQRPAMRTVRTVNSAPAQTRRIAGLPEPTPLMPTTRSARLILDASQMSVVSQAPVDPLARVIPLDLPAFSPATPLTFGELYFADLNPGKVPADMLAALENGGLEEDYGHPFRAKCRLPDAECGVPMDVEYDHGAESVDEILIAQHVEKGQLIWLEPTRGDDGFCLVKLTARKVTMKGRVLSNKVLFSQSKCDEDADSWSQQLDAMGKTYWTFARQLAKRGWTAPASAVAASMNPEYDGVHAAYIQAGQLRGFIWLEVANPTVKVWWVSADNSRSTLITTQTVSKECWEEDTEERDCNYGRMMLGGVSAIADDSLLLSLEHMGTSCHDPGYTVLKRFKPRH